MTERQSVFSLDRISEGQQARIWAISGSSRFISRVTAIGLTEGCVLDVVQNVRKRPVLVYTRDSAIAVDREDCTHIHVEVIS